MPVFRPRLAMTLVLGMLVAGCAHRQPVEVTPMPEGKIVGNAEGDQIMTAWFTAHKVAKGSISLVMRTFDDGGKLGVCGAYVIGGTDVARATMRSQLRGSDSRVRFGDKVALAPLLFRENTFPAPEVAGADVAIKLNELQGNCVRVEVPWDEAFRKPISLVVANRPCTKESCS
jgi:hypothetical protein